MLWPVEERIKIMRIFFSKKKSGCERMNGLVNDGY